MHGTCIETPPQHAEGEDEPVVFSFFTDISANPAIIDLVTTLSKSVQNTLGMLNKYLTRWRRYRLLWKLDKVGIESSWEKEIGGGGGGDGGNVLPLQFMYLFFNPGNILMVRASKDKL